jgi:hypothetical protein
MSTLEELEHNLFYCPISMCIMNDPVIAEDGLTYERSSIEEHLKTSNISPITREEISKTLIPNKSLRSCIRDKYPNLPAPKTISSPQLFIKSVLRRIIFEDVSSPENFHSYNQIPLSRAYTFKQDGNNCASGFDINKDSLNNVKMYVENSSKSKKNNLFFFDINTNKKKQRNKN